MCNLISACILSFEYFCDYGYAGYFFASSISSKYVEKASDSSGLEIIFTTLKQYVTNVTIVVGKLSWISLHKWELQVMNVELWESILYSLLQAIIPTQLWESFILLPWSNCKTSYSYSSKWLLGFFLYKGTKYVFHFGFSPQCWLCLCQLQSVHVIFIDCEKFFITNLADIP